MGRGIQRAKVPTFPPPDEINTMMELKDQFVREMKRMFGDEYAHFACALEQKTPKSIRFNPNRLKDFAIADSMFRDAEPVPWAEGAIYVEDDEYLTKHPYYAAGLYYFQEASAMAPVTYLPLSEGMKVLDLCAAPGGKSLQIASKIGETGVLLSNDISVSRQRATLRNFEKFGLKNVLVSAESPEKIAKNYPAYFDAILVDAPCSGEGMFAKDKKTLSAWTEESNAFYAEKQLQILQEIASALKGGGYLMYSTCTFSDLENEELIRRFLSSREDFSLVKLEGDLLSDSLPSLPGAKRILPHKQKGLGHFLALLQKAETPQATDQAVSSPLCFKAERPRLSKKQAEEREDAIEAFQDFCLALGLEERRVLGAGYRERLQFFSGKLYCNIGMEVPDASLRLLRNGLLLGDFEKGQFHPSQAFAMCLSSADVKRCFDWDSGHPDLLKYLRGESLSGSESKGYLLICVDRLPLGWVYSDGKRLKNKLKRDWLQ